MLLPLAALLLVAQPAGSSPASCQFDLDTHTVTIVLERNVTSRIVRTAGGQILFLAPTLYSESCGGANVSNTDRIEVTGDVGSRLVVDARQGVFAPGFTDEDGGDEIEIRVVMPSSDNELDYEGVVSESNHVVSGLNGFNVVVPGDELPLGDSEAPGDDVDVRYEGVDGRITILGGQADDIIDARGHSDGTGQSRRGERLFIFGGRPGEGASGNDELRGSRGRDRLNGLDGNDTIQGDDRVDTIVGGPGQDTLRGDHGGDDIDAFDGEADVINGGNKGDLQGDHALVDCGLDVVEEVEEVECG
jgi:Ca2+-binding RTX toxin-like protein